MPPAVSPKLRKRMLEVALAAETDFSLDLDISTLAENAQVSEKHFQRAFRAVFDESPKRYVRRIRLQAAAYMLKWSDTPIAHLGLNAGFNTPAGFNKAFAKAYGRSPQAFRNDRNVSPYLRASKNRTNVFAPAGVEPVPFNVRLERVPERRIAFMRHIGPTEKMAEVWPTFLVWLRQHQLFHEHAELLGVHNDTWDEQSEDRYRYDAAVVVPPDFQADDAVNTRVLPASQTAMVEFNGSVGEADRAWRRLAEHWLPASGYRPSGSYGYDRYPTSLFKHGVLGQILATLTGIRATLCLPVKR